MRELLRRLPLCLLAFISLLPCSCFSPMPSGVSPKAIPQVTILSTTSYREGSRGQYLWCDGEVRNDSAKQVKYLQAAVTWYNESDTILATKIFYLEPVTVGPGDRATFHVPGDYSPGLVSYRVSIICNDRMVAETKGTIR